MPANGRRIPYCFDGDSSVAHITHGAFRVLLKLGQRPLSDVALTEEAEITAARELVRKGFACFAKVTEGKKLISKTWTLNSRGVALCDHATALEVR